MGEVRVNGEGFTDSPLLHDDEAQAVHGTVRLILVSLEVVKGRSLFVWSGPMDARQLFIVKLIPQLGRHIVADLAGQCDRLDDDVICCEQVIDEPQILEGAKDFDDAQMVSVSLRDEREEKPRIEKNHAFGWP